MLEIIKVADEYKLPILADEVYYGLVFGENSEYHSFGNLTSDVPVIVKSQITH
jgi:aspartate/methionine/tyrosine aminotransferase